MPFGRFINSLHLLKTFFAQWLLQPMFSFICKVSEMGTKEEQLELSAQGKSTMGATYQDRSGLAEYCWIAILFRDGPTCRH